MELLREITEKDIGITPPSNGECTHVRNAARAILYDDDGKIALLYVAGDNYYKLPGGGVEDGESIEAALHREAMEETGAAIEITGEVGMIVEKRNAYQTTQISYCYIAKVVGTVAQPSFTESELSDGFAADWVSPREALMLIKNSVPQGYHGKFIQIRDMAFLTKAMEIAGAGLS